MNERHLIFRECELSATLYLEIEHFCMKTVYSGLQKSMDGHYIRMKWPYFQSFKNIRNTARKALKPFWLNAQHSEVSKMLCYALLARLDLAQCTKSSQSYEKYAIFSQIDQKQAKKANFS